ncbi:MAG: hypothetical protein KKF41_16080 [Actinobacteria bacterium]|nr:hypothetical protein [Actinomycetota bacterium]MBU1944545.1 hypothetical protein [Actinomycetota bacterium]MBU2689098.1 hypothetical protein [Actinomycetota bacterium]
MIFHKLVARFLRHGDDEEFYCIQAEEAARWRPAGSRRSRAGPQLAFLARVSLLREFLTWNCAVLMESAGTSAPALSPAATGARE